MSTVTIFGGIQPRTHERLLPIGGATIAQDACLRNGVLNSWHKPLPIQDAITNGLTVWTYGEKIITWNRCVAATTYLPDWVEVYLTGRDDVKAEVMRFEDNVAEYTYLGVPQPSKAPSTIGGGQSGEDCDQRSYIYTYVNEWGEEGRPSLACNPITVRDGSSVTVYGFATPPSGYGIVSINIYRTATGLRSGQETEQKPATVYLRVATILTGTSSYADTKEMQSLGVAIETEDYRIPPDYLRHIRHMEDSGILVGHTANMVHFSEKGAPWAWPSYYDLTLESNIVNLVTLNDWVFVTTTTRPYVVDGKYDCKVPRACRQVEQMDTAMPDISCGYANSAIATPFGAVYSSPIGPVLLTPNGQFELFLRNHVDVPTWRKWAPDTARFAWWNGYLFIVTDRIGLLYEWDVIKYNDSATGTLVTISDRPVDMHTTTSGELLMFDGAAVSQWDASPEKRPYTWCSRPFTFGGRATPSSMKVDTDGTTMTMKVPTGTAWSRFIGNDKAVRLGRIGRHLFYQVQFDGTEEVRYMLFNTSYMAFVQGG